MTGAIAGALLGASGAVGLLLAVTAAPYFSRLRLDERVGPYLLGGQPTADGARVRAVRRATARPLVALLEGVVSSSSVRVRLARAGDTQSVDAFRAEQLRWSGCGLLVGLLLLVVGVTSGHRTAPLLVIPALAALTGAVARDVMLSSAVARRERRMVAELPTIADLLALSVAAGESVHGALSRVTALARGELSRDLAGVLAGAAAGRPLMRELEVMATATAVPAVSRFLDGMVVAIERGTPLAEVLRAQAADVRAEQRRALIETAGRKEIAMLFPVVFLVLPVTVVFALFPGFANITLTTP